MQNKLTETQQLIDRPATSTQHILLADPRFVFRQGLRGFFSKEFGNAFFEEATTATSFEIALAARSYDFVVINQALLLELADVPEGISIVLASQPNKEILLAAHARHSRAYLNENPSEELLRFVVHLKAGRFWVDAAFFDWLIGLLAERSDSLSPMQAEFLTPRQQEIAVLLNQGRSYSEIANQLTISVETVKRHAADIRERIRRHKQQNRFQANLHQKCTPQ